jgi:hypothetical protein
MLEFCVHKKDVTDAQLTAAFKGLTPRTPRRGKTVKLPPKLDLDQFRRLQQVGQWLRAWPHVRVPSDAQTEALAIVKYFINSDADARRVKAALFGIQVIGRNIVPGQWIRLIESANLDAKMPQLMKMGKFGARSILLRLTRVSPITGSLALRA